MEKRSSAERSSEKIKISLISKRSIAVLIERERIAGEQPIFAFPSLYEVV